jgi:hypothetical protein
VVCIDYLTSLPRIGSEPCVSDDLIRIAPSDSQPTDAVPPSLSLPGSEHVKESKPVTDPAATAECEQPIPTADLPIPITDTVSGEPPAPMTSQGDTHVQPVSLSGGCAPSQVEDKVDMVSVEAVQNSEDQQTGGSPFICWTALMSHHHYRLCSSGKSYNRGSV